MDLDAMHRVAVDLARSAGVLAVARRATAVATAKGSAGDVVTDVDRECERRIVAGLRDRFPDDGILGEESGRHGPDGAAVEWLVDPLDGTNNFVLGLGLHGVCITACSGGSPLMAVAHDAGSRRTFAAIAGRGATVDSRPVRTGAAPPLPTATVSWTQGYGVDPDDAERNRAFTALERSTKRVLRTWAPSIDWGLLASGRIAGVVAYRNEPWDLVGGVLIACEAGAATARDAAGRWVVTAHPAVLPQLLAVLGIAPSR